MSEKPWIRTESIRAGKVPGWNAHNDEAMERSETVKEKVSALLFAQEGDQYIGRSYEDIDCQELAELMLRGVGIQKNLRGSNAWFRAMTWTGTPEECRKVYGEIPVGAFLFIWDGNGGEKQRGYSDGLGNASHMGVYIGRMGGAIHASKSRGCVAYSEFKGRSIRGGWNRVGLWDWMDYGERINGILAGNPSSVSTDKGKEVKTMTERDMIVTADSGTTVNLRAKADIGGALVCRIPLGETVLASPVGDGTWSAVTWGIRNGYMMTKFLRERETDAQTSSVSANALPPSPEGKAVATSTDLQAPETNQGAEVDEKLNMLEWMKGIEMQIQQLDNTLSKLCVRVLDLEDKVE